MSAISGIDFPALPSASSAPRAPPGKSLIGNVFRACA